MLPALRSDRMAYLFCLLLISLLGLPVALSLLSLDPPRVEAYKSMTVRSGSLGGVIRAIYSNHDDGDIVFLGSSLVNAAIDRDGIQSALSAHLQRKSSVAVLALNWPGLDQQYFLLRDYLSQHKLKLLVWNPPEPHSRAYDAPHIQAYRFVRYGEYNDALRGLPLSYRASLYGEMVLGAPRQLLSRLRPNRIGDEALDVSPALARTGYLGRPFVADHLKPGPALAGDYLLPPDAQLLRVVGPTPGPYQIHFARKIMELAAAHGCAVVILHIPIDLEYGSATVPELADWPKSLGEPVKELAVPSEQIFGSIPKSRFLNFYRDEHLNENGRYVFSQSILPSLLGAYDEADHEANPEANHDR